jgi:hypothetical protein
VIRAVCAFVCGAALLTGAASAAVPPAADMGDFASAALSSPKAGTKPVSLAVALHTELQCGKLRAGTLSLTFPDGFALPSTVGPSAVLVNGVNPSKVKLTGRTLSITMPLRTGITCMVIAPGTAKILVTKAAQLGNPGSAGAYMLGVRYKTELLKAKLTITA